MQWRWLFLPALWVFATTPLVGLPVSMILGFCLLVVMVIPLEYLALTRRHDYAPDADLLANAYKYDH